MSVLGEMWERTFYVLFLDSSTLRASDHQFACAGGVFFNCRNARARWLLLAPTYLCDLPFRQRQATSLAAIYRGVCSLQEIYERSLHIRPTLISSLSVFAL